MSKRSALKKSRELIDSLQPDEEFFPLMGRDRATPLAIRQWAHIWLTEIRLGARPESDRIQVTEGVAMATRMEIRLRDLELKAQHEATEFGPMDQDGSRVPLRGEHARRSRNSTSGANDE